MANIIHGFTLIDIREVSTSPVVPGSFHGAVTDTQVIYSHRRDATAGIEMHADPAGEEKRLWSGDSKMIDGFEDDIGRLVVTDRRMLFETLRQQHIGLTREDWVIVWEVDVGRVDGVSVHRGRLISRTAVQVRSGEDRMLFGLIADEARSKAEEIWGAVGRAKALSEGSIPSS